MPPQTPFDTKTTHMKRTPSSVRIIPLGMLLTTTQLYAQEERIAAPPADRWGFRISLSVNEPSPEPLLPVGITFSHLKHQFYAGVILTPFEAEANSPLFGSGISYQYFLFPERTCFNLYAYASVQGGKYTVDNEVYFFYPSDTSFVRGTTRNSTVTVSGLAGLGFEARFGARCYASVAFGGGMYYRHRAIKGAFTESTDKTPPKTDDQHFTGMAAEISVGFGYRF